MRLADVQLHRRGNDIRSEDTREIDGTSNLSQLWKRDILENAVVGNQGSTSNGRQLWQSNVGKSLVGNEREGSLSATESSDGGQIWCRERLHVCSVETKGTVDNSERWNADAGQVTESHLLCPDQVWQLDGEISIVGGNVDERRDGLDLSAESGQSSVVADVESIYRVEVDAVESAQEGVGDDHALCGADGGWESESTQVTKSSPLDVSNRCELLEREGGQLLETVELECASDALDGVGADGEQLGGIGSSEATSDRSWTVQCDSVACLGTNNDITVDSCAGSVEVGIGLSVDLGVAVASIACLG